MKKCPHGKIADVNGKVSDALQLRLFDRGRQGQLREIGKRDWGYVPEGIGLDDGTGYGDYIRFKYCLSCGLILSTDFPVSDKTLSKIFSRRSLSMAALSGHR